MKSLGKSRAQLVSTAGFISVGLLIGARIQMAMSRAQPSGKSAPCAGSSRSEQCLPLHLHPEGCGSACARRPPELRGTQRPDNRAGDSSSTTNSVSESSKSALRTPGALSAKGHRALRPSHVTV